MEASLHLPITLQLDVDILYDTSIFQLTYLACSLVYTGKIDSGHERYIWRNIRISVSTVNL